MTSTPPSAEGDTSRRKVSECGPATYHGLTEGSTTTHTQHTACMGPLVFPSPLLFKMIPIALKFSRQGRNFTTAMASRSGPNALKIIV